VTRETGAAPGAPAPRTVPPSLASRFVAVSRAAGQLSPRIRRTSMVYPVQMIADYLIGRVNTAASGDAITNLELQLLLYFVQGVHLVARGDALFAADLVAGAHGPLVQEVYDRYRQYGPGAIPTRAHLDPSAVDSETVAVLEEGLGAYTQYVIWGQRTAAHDGPPWRDTPQGAVIPTAAIHQFFADHLRQ
jgi:uncharacterized phage-associated protein